MGFGLVNKWVGQGSVSKMGWLDFFFFFELKKVNNAEGAVLGYLWDQRQ